MKIIVINAPFIKDFCRCQRWPARTRGRALRMPDWLCYAAAVLKNEGIDTELYDFVARGWDKKKLFALLKEKKPDFLILDSTTPSIFSDLECAHIAKDAAGAKVIMVGPHATALPEETLRNSQGSVDLIALGEFDYTIADIIRQWPNISAVEGIAFLKDDAFTRTPPRRLIEDLDALPFPSRQGLDIMHYFDAGRLYPYIDIIGGRGCPYQCTFCQWPQVIFGHHYRFRSAKNIVDEIEYDLQLFPLLRYGEFFFEDDTFTVNKERAWEICKEISRRNLKINWSANARPDIYDIELFKEMKRLGCREFLVGFESGNQQILDNVKKGVTLAQSREFMRTAKEAKISVHGCFVVGLPGETKETAQETIDFALSLGVDTLQFSAAVPLPGSAYFKYCKDAGLLQTQSWQDWLDGGEQGAVVAYPGLSIEEINALVNKGLRKFYLRPQFILRFAFTNKNIFDLFRKCKGMYNFISYLLTKG